MKRRAKSRTNSRRRISRRPISQLYPFHPYNFARVILLLAVFILVLHQLFQGNHIRQDRNHEHVEPSLNSLFTLRSVPSSVSRFDFPWHLPIRQTPLPLSHSQHRVLYSPLRLYVGHGLGHAMATLNGELHVAFRLNLTYTHRIGVYGTLTESYPQTVEQFLGCGVDSPPREAVLRSIPMCESIEDKMDENPYFCPICTNAQVEDHDNDNDNDSTDSTLIVKRIVSLSLNITYGLRPYSNPLDDERIREFMQMHPHPRTAFSLPPQLCDRVPAYSTFTSQTRAFFFHKYWDAHRSRRSNAIDRFESSISKNESFVEFRRRVTASNRIAPFQGRVSLSNVHDMDTITIAIFVGHVTNTTTIARLIQVIAYDVIRHHRLTNMKTTKFDDFPITVKLYSDCRKDVRYVETENAEKKGQQQRLLTATGVMSTLSNHEEEDEFSRNGIKVIMRIRERDVVCALHEMIAADVFIAASDNDMAQHVVGSLSRAAFVVAQTKGADKSNRFVKYEQNGGHFKKREVLEMRRLWNMFVQYN